MPQVKPATHEFKGHLYYYPEDSDRYDGLDPYWFIGQLLIQNFDGHGVVETTLDGEVVHVDLGYSKSGFAPRPQDDVSERLYEWELHVDGYGERKCHYNISPRFPNIRHYQTRDKISLPFDHLDAPEGMTIQYQSSNVDVDEIPVLLRDALEALAGEAGVQLNPHYFRRPRGGIIDELERYVRATRDMNQKLIQDGGLMNRMALLLSSEQGTKGKRTWDNVECVGHHHQVVLDAAGAESIIPHHQLGRQIKSYLPKHPQNFEPEDPLYHPKIGVLFRKSLNNRTVHWRDRHDLVESLDETIINCLSWADIPVRVGDSGGSNATFVADDHFDASPRDDALTVLDDPTPRLDAQQDHLLMTILRDMTESDAEIVETVATDGGQHVKDLSKVSGYSLSTIYRALQRLDGVIESEQGHVRFASKKIAQEIRSIVESAEYAVKSAADRAAKLFDVEINQRSNSVVGAWLAEYGATFEPTENGKGKIRIDTILSQLKSAPCPQLSDVMDYLVHAWVRDGRNHVDIENVIVEADLWNGDSVSAPVKALR